MSDNEEENKLTASEVCLASIEDCILDDDKDDDEQQQQQENDTGKNEIIASESEIKPETVPDENGTVAESDNVEEDCVADNSPKQEPDECTIETRSRGVKRKLENDTENGTCVQNGSIEDDDDDGNVNVKSECEAESDVKDGDKNKKMKQCCEDEALQRSKENSESDTRVSTASENSTPKKVVKKKRGHKRFWFRRKKGKDKKYCKKQGYESDFTGSTFDDCGSGNTSPSLSEHFSNKNRKFSDSSDSSKKNREFAIPSPSLADITMKAAIPESTATSVEISKQGLCLCLCRKRPQIFVSSDNSAGDLYCQGLDWINNRIIGCCNPIPSTDVGLFRASEKACFQMMCNLHQQRLLRHNCCPGCGLFCTRGRFMMCKSMHHYHKACSLENERGVLVCPHCGDDTPPKCVIMFMNTAKDPILLPQQKPPRTLKAAKMSITRGVPEDVEEDREPEFNFPAMPFNFMPQQTDGGAEQPVNGDIYTYKNLHTSVQSGDVNKVLKILASGLNPNHEYEEDNKRNSLHIAAAKGHLTVVHILLQAQTQINAMDAEQNTPLTAAIVAKQNDVVKYLVRCGANLILKSEDGMTPLHIAAKCGNVGACRHILNATNLPPRYIDGLDDGGWTPIVWASEFNHIDVVRFLISKGADPSIRDAEQNIALHWAAFGGSLDIVEYYLNEGSDINVVNVHGDTPLHIAARQDKYNCVLLLLARGANSNIKNKAGEYARDCSESQQSDIYRGISLNMQISDLLGRFQERSPQIVSNDISHGKERNQIQCVNSVDDEPEPEDFIYVTESCFTSKITVDRTINSLQSCRCRDICDSVHCNCANISIKCWYDNDGRLKSDFNYTDPPMIFECNQACQCNRITCHNRVVQNGINCRIQLFKTENRGWGIKTLNLIPKGTYVCEYVGEIISDCEADHREDDSYLFDLDNRDGETYCIDARRYGNFARFINHMCVPNLMPVHVFVDHQDIRFPRIAFFANRDIMPDEELGYNYGEKFWVIKWKSFTCTCGAEKCMYSEKTIKTTLENYNKKLQEENS